jgi:hypothetical protein
MTKIFLVIISLFTLLSCNKRNINSEYDIYFPYKGSEKLLVVNGNELYDSVILLGYSSNYVSNRGSYIKREQRKLLSQWHSADINALKNNPFLTALMGNNDSLYFYFDFGLNYKNLSFRAFLSVLDSRQLMALRLDSVSHNDVFKVQNSKECIGNKIEYIEYIYWSINKGLLFIKINTGEELIVKTLK